MAQLAQWSLILQPIIFFFCIVYYAVVSFFSLFYFAGFGPSARRSVAAPPSRRAPPCTTVPLVGPWGCRLLTGPALQRHARFRPAPRGRFCCLAHPHCRRDADGRQDRMAGAATSTSFLDHLSVTSRVSCVSLCLVPVRVACGLVLAIRCYIDVVSQSRGSFRRTPTPPSPPPTSTQ